jgi:hypothetical protein
MTTKVLIPACRDQGDAWMTTLHHVDTPEMARTVGPARRKGPMEQLIETLAGGLGNSVAWLAENGILFGIFALIWIAFGAGLI